MRLDDLTPIADSAPIMLKATSKLPTQYGSYKIHVFEDVKTKIEHVALVLGSVNGKSNVLTRVHSECLTGDVFSSKRCDCGEQLKLAQTRIFDAQQGVIIYLRGHEGRGIGLTNKILAYELQDNGLDTVEANLELNLPIDSRKYEIAAEIIKALNIESINLLTNNPDKVSSLLSSEVLIDQIQSIHTVASKESEPYLRTKKLKLGHFL